MHGQPTPLLVYRYLYPSPRNTDPPCFSAHLKHNLVPEIRTETSTFYGSFNSLEAKYPGLDYTHPPHRMRLGRFVHHRRLFRAFDDLGLTKNEILGFCQWEGTRWARESYEKQERIRIRDTTGEEIKPGVDGALRPKRTSVQTVQVEVARLGHAPQVETRPELQEDYRGDEQGEEESGDVDEEEGEEEDDGEGEEGRDGDDSEEELESVGIELNQRLSAAAEARERGADVVMDEAWEQWLKEASEQGILADPTSAFRAGYSFPSISAMSGPPAVPSPTPAVVPPTPATGTAS